MPALAGNDVIAGAYTSNTFDVTHLVRRGTNAIAYLVYPGNPMTDLSIGWVDWNQWPPDNNMGIWRDVLIRTTGPVRLSNPRVTTELSPGLDIAHLVVTCDAVNLTGETLVSDMHVSIAGPTGCVELRGQVAFGDRRRGDDTSIPNRNRAARSCSLVAGGARPSAALRPRHASKRGRGPERPGRRRRSASDR